MHCVAEASASERPSFLNVEPLGVVRVIQSRCMFAKDAT